MQDKKLRISADTSPLEGLRRDVRAIWEEFNSLEKEFGGLSSETLNIIQKQIDLLKERNKLISPNSNVITELRGGNVNSLNGDRNVPQIIDPYTGKPISSDNTENSTRGLRSADFSMIDKNYYNRVISELVRIADILEKGYRDGENIPEGAPVGEGSAPVIPEGVKPEQQDDDGTSQGFSFDSLKNFKLPNMASIMGLLPFGAALYGIGQMIGQQAQFEVGQYAAENRFQRENQIGSHWLLNALTFGVSGAEAQKKEIARMAAERNDEVLNRYASLHNYSYEQALQKQLNDSFGENVRHIENIKDDTLTDSKFVPQWGSPTVGGSAYSIVNTGERTKALEGAEEAGITEDEYHNWASRTLGLNVTEYIDRLTRLQKAGAYERNTSMYDMNQMLLAERIRGISIDEMMPLLRATRFSDNMTGSQVLRTIDTNLQGQGKSDQYIASMLGEYIQSFSRTIERMYDVKGTVDTRSIVGAMTSIQNMTGMEGRQLERVQGALMGQDISKDDVTQALLMRTARELNPEGNLSDLLADIEKMPEDIDMQKAFFEKLKEMTGGGEMMRHVMKAVFPSLSYNDIRDLETVTGNEADVIWGRIRTSGGAYSEENAASKVGAAERSAAGTANRQIIDGISNTLEQQGTSLKEVLDKVYTDPLPVMLVSGKGKEKSEPLNIDFGPFVNMLIQGNKEAYREFMMKGNVSIEIEGD